MPLRVLEYNTRELIRFSNDTNHKCTRKLPLVATLVLNFSDGPWNTPKSLLDMAEYRDAWLDKTAEQGRLLLLDPYAMNDKKLSRFCTDLKFMLYCWKFSRDDVALQTFLESQRGLVFPSMEMKRTLYMFFNIEFDDKKEKADGGIGVMCEAIRKIREKGKIEGIKEGLTQGIEKGKEDVAINALRMKLSIKTIQKLTGLSLESIKGIAQSVAML